MFHESRVSYYVVFSTYSFLKFFTFEILKFWRFPHLGENPIKQNLLGKRCYSGISLHWNLPKEDTIGAEKNVRFIEISALKRFCLKLSFEQNFDQKKLFMLFFTRIVIKWLSTWKHRYLYGVGFVESVVRL